MTTPLAKAEGAYTQTTIDDEVVVMSLDSGEFFSLTGTARAVWEHIDGRRDSAEIADLLAAEFALPVDRVRPDVAAFAQQLLAAGLVRRA